MDGRGTRLRAGREVIPAVAVLLVTWLLLWWAQSIPTICALAHPCPAPDVRVAPALLFGGLMLIPVVAIVPASGFGRRGHTRLLIASYIVLVALALVGLLAVLFSGGFGFPLL
ncbi:hypothetical protein [Microbacterium sp. LWH13-1.2]|uniref:hypothetical protein n=1 Tax=Microbacterium sp. LWH13-1.2 TaxID=3135260 RepID=UPI0031392925